MTSVLVASSARTSANSRWWLFCFLVLTLKLLLLVLDPVPKLFMGDSGSYLYTAISGWIPGDRSYFYGYLIRLISIPVHSLFPLLLLQSYLSGLTAIIVAVCCRSFLVGPNSLAFCMGILCAVDPLQLLWERYVMAETISLFLYILLLYCALHYIKRQRRRDLALVQLLGVLTIGFRMSYLIVVELTAVILPLLAYFPHIAKTVRRWPAGRHFRIVISKGLCVDTVLSVVLMFVLHRGYTEANGWLTHRQPAYLYATGLHLLAFWAPILNPQDAADPRLADIIAHGDEYGLRDPAQRNGQRFLPSGLVGRFTAVEPDPIKANEIARQTALHAFRRAPLQVALLALRTYAQFWDFGWLRKAARNDFGHDLSPGTVPLLAKHFAWTTHAGVTTDPPTFLQHYYLIALPYYLFVVLSPVGGILAIWLSRDWRLPFLLFVHSTVMLVVTCALAPQAIIRYLHPISPLALLTMAAVVQAAIDRRRGTAHPSPSWLVRQNRPEKQIA